MTPEKDLKRYLEPEKLIESNDPYIRQIAKGIKGNTREEILENIYKYIQDNMNYALTPNLGAKQALKQKKGKCTEYSSIMIALCRAKNIPARMVIGNIAREKETSHNWVEVYFDNYGWVVYDPTVFPTNVKVYKNGKLQNVKKRYDVTPNINYITSGRNKMSVYNSSYSVSDTRNGNVSIIENITIEKI